MAAGRPIERDGFNFVKSEVEMGTATWVAWFISLTVFAFYFAYTISVIQTEIGKCVQALERIEAELSKRNYN